MPAVVPTLLCLEFLGGIMADLILHFYTTY